ncbi:unnamed protein product, partial [Laminaria digitata]
MEVSLCHMIRTRQRALAWAKPRPTPSKTKTRPSSSDIIRHQRRQPPYKVTIKTYRPLVLLMLFIQAR